MSRIPTPSTIDDAPEASRSTLEAVQKQIGSVSNIFRIVSNSPAVLAGNVGLNGALAKGTFPAATRERIALAVAEINGCGYSLAAHTYLGTIFAKLDEKEIASNRVGGSTEAKAAAAVRFPVVLTVAQGAATARDIEAVRSAGYSDAEIVEIIAHVTLSALQLRQRGTGNGDRLPCRRSVRRVT